MVWFWLRPRLLPASGRSESQSLRHRGSTQPWHQTAKSKRQLIMAAIPPRAVMSTVFGDRFALAAMGILGVGVVWTVSKLIVTVMEDNKIEPPKPKTQYITQET